MPAKKMYYFGKVSGVLTCGSLLVFQIEQQGFFSRIYPVKELFERFKLDMENSWDFCGVVKESVTHLFFECIYSKLFWLCL